MGCQGNRTEQWAADPDELRQLAGYYRRHLVDDVMGFWDARVADPDHPGHLHQFDRTGALAGTDKYVWCQGRQTYMYAALYAQLEPRDAWLALARRGRDVLVHHAHAGGGRFHYQLHRDGRVASSDRSWFTDAFALTGLCQHAEASGSDEDLPLIEQTFDALERHFHAPGFSEYHHFQLDPTLRYHAPAMVGVGMAPVLRAVLGPGRVDAFVEQCLKRVLWEFASDEHRVLFEVLDSEGRVLQTPAGLTVNPGHALESMWFCLEEAMHRGDERAVDRAVEVTRWAYDNGVDREHGGILAATDPTGQPPPPEARTEQFGAAWDTKIWWVHAEALYTLALAALARGDGGLWQAFLDQHAYARARFADPEHGEWYKYLERDGRPRDTSKGSWIKSAFHIPRALLKLTRLLEHRAGGD